MQIPAWLAAEKWLQEVEDVIERPAPAEDKTHTPEEYGLPPEGDYPF